MKSDRLPERVFLTRDDLAGKKNNGTNDNDAGVASGATAQQLLSESYARLRSAVTCLGNDTLPTPARMDAALAALPRREDVDGDDDDEKRDSSYLGRRGAKATLDHIVQTVVPALTGQNLTGRYFGFVTGSTLPVAEAADNVVSALDQNVQVHLPSQTVCTAVEDAALQMLVDFLQLEPGPSPNPSPNPRPKTRYWGIRTFTTGATASNVLGLAQGREAVISARLPSEGRHNGNTNSVAAYGLLKACRLAGIDDIRVLTSMGHSSLYKAASIVGLGRDSVQSLPYSTAEPWRLNLDAVERELVAAGPSVAHILVVSAGEVNTGRFATTGRQDMQRLRSLADVHKAWIHVDGAFGLFARALPDTEEFAYLRQCTEGLEWADSITSDGHKILNVPYDTGIFFSRHRQTQVDVFENPNAAYLTAGGAKSAAASTAATPSADADIPSPLNIGIENSRRFRALPVYAVLLSEGREGLTEMLVRMVRLARGIRGFLEASPAYDVLPQYDGDCAEHTHMVVLFRAKDETVNAELVNRINATRQMYVSPTSWQGKPACRVAVSSWRVDVDEDLKVVQGILTRVAAP